MHKLSIINDNLIRFVSIPSKECLSKLTFVKAILNTTNSDLELRFESKENVEPYELILLENDIKSILDGINCLTINLKNTGFENKEVAKEEVLLGKNFKNAAVKIESINEESQKVVLSGEVFDFQFRNIKNDRTIVTIDLTDYTSSISCKVFLENKPAMVLESKLSKGQFVKIRGECRYDKFSKEIIVALSDLIALPTAKRTDDEKHKRVEYHLHTNMSSMDAVSSVEEIVKRASLWGHEAVAITDHGIVQAFPEAYECSKKYGVKIIYGVEAYILNDHAEMIANHNDNTLDQVYVVLDVETTGLSPRIDKIIEIAAVKVLRGQILETFHSMINPQTDIPSEITKLTGITNAMVKDAPIIEEVLERFHIFCGDNSMVAHNAPFDLSFIKENANRIGLTFDNPIIDTLSLSRELLKELKKHNLASVSSYFNITAENFHRALDDVHATAQILFKFLQMLESKGAQKLSDVNDFFQSKSNLNSLHAYHCVILAKNSKGLNNLYKLISASHIDYFYRKPRIPKSLILKYRDGLILGTGCNQGELFKAALRNAQISELKEIVDFYDYIEVQPAVNNKFLVEDKVLNSIDEINDINKALVDLGKLTGKLVIATGDVHYLDPQDAIYRKILQSVQGFKDDNSEPCFYYKTTREMLDEFSFLGDELSREIVVTNALQLSKQIEPIRPIPDGFYPPKIAAAEIEVRKITLRRAASMYGSPLPDLIESRLSRELEAIIGNDFAVLYYIAYKLVKKSMSDGYLVGSRGSVGSSLVATMMGITEVNPLPPHYICNSCKFSDFSVDVSKFHCGIDLPDRNCPVCGHKLIRDGFDIPFEVFMGFDGDKVPDIDLNFSGEYQPIAHKYAEEIFGKGKVYRAGTIGTIAEKTAFGFVKKYLEDKNKTISSTETKRLMLGCTGVKRTTGQHPGGVIVVPDELDIHQFTPIQYPADDKKSDVVTTHFDYHAISSRLIKLDILGHDDPTMIKMMEDITGIKGIDIPLDDAKTMSIFSGVTSLDIKPIDIGSEIGTFGIPEFGTRFVRQMLTETMPSTFSELVRISGLSHGTDVWLNNAQELIRNNIAHLTEVISTRDDIMVYLLYKGINPSMAFDIMETVRKGKPLSSNLVSEMIKNGVPDWFIESCRKIKYMFPKAHAVAYVMMAYRIAYFKVHFPKAFYAAYFTIRADDFDEDAMLFGKTEVVKRISELESKNGQMTNKDKNLLTVLEVMLEMICRNIPLLSLDLYKSDATKFIVTTDGLLPPFNAFPGVGINAANGIVEARNMKAFLSIEDFVKRTRVTKTVLGVLKKTGCLDGIAETKQLKLF